MIKQKKIIKIIFFVYIIALIFFLFFKSPYRLAERRFFGIFSPEHFNSCNLIPFKTITAYIKVLINHRMNFDIIVMNLLGNLLLFLPMGVFLPLIFKEKFNKFWKYLVFIIITVIFVEVLQFITFLGSLDIDDFILNVIGAIIGFLIYKICNKIIGLGGKKNVITN